jgi:hypothetical protein
MMVVVQASMVLVLLVAVAVLVLVVRSGARQQDGAAAAAVTEQLNRLALENLRLHRAIGVAEQALRSVAGDTRLDAGLALQVDAALDDVRRAARGDDDGRTLGR